MRELEIETASAQRAGNHALVQVILKQHQSDLQQQETQLEAEKARQSALIQQRLAQRREVERKNKEKQERSDTAKIEDQKRSANTATNTQAHAVCGEFSH